MIQVALGSHTVVNTAGSPVINGPLLYVHPPPSDSRLSRLDRPTMPDVETAAVDSAIEGHDRSANAVVSLLRLPSAGIVLTSLSYLRNRWTAVLRPVQTQEGTSTPTFLKHCPTPNRNPCRSLTWISRRPIYLIRTIQTQTANPVLPSHPHPGFPESQQYTANMPLHRQNSTVETSMLLGDGSAGGTEGHTSHDDPRCNKLTRSQPFTRVSSDYGDPLRRYCSY